MGRQRPLSLKDIPVQVRRPAHTQSRKQRWDQSSAHLLGRTQRRGWDADGFCPSGGSKASSGSREQVEFEP